EDGGTFVTIAESGWREDEAGHESSYGNCEGWSQMLACMKAYVEYGINLREGFYPSEMRGELPTSDSK
ncbi:MAG: ATPase, partial [Mesorhizobium sp.]